MKRASFIVLPLVLVLGFWLARRSASQLPARDDSATSVVNTNVAAATVAIPALAGSTNHLPGEIILRGYADTNLPPENDLTLMSRLMENSLLLLKSAANRPLSANEDWAGLLRGQNAAHENFLPDKSVALNTQGQLIDRWGTPLFFHALGGGRFELRSAGPDKKLWTEDDIHRNADGSFRRGRDLESASLLESSTRRR